MGNIKIIIALLNLLLIGCNSLEDKISEGQAKVMVIDHHENDIGKVEIVDVTIKFNKYIIEWENKQNCENGIDSVNKKGEITMIEASIC